MRIVRLYNDQEGESHFGEDEINLNLTDYAPPAAPLYLSGTTKGTDFAFMNAPAGWSSDWHPSSASNLFFVLSGEWEVTASDGEARRFGVGSVLLVEDTAGKGHTSRVIGETDSLAAMVSLVKVAPRFERLGPSDLDSWCARMGTGYCLWVGAGLTVQMTGENVPQWAELTSELEAKAKAKGKVKRKANLSVDPESDYPTRLGKCLDELDAKEFQAFLRNTYYTKICMTLLRQAKRALQDHDFIPRAVRQVACLGQFANPIVNFNIEPFSSLLLARPAGPMRLLSYTQPDELQVTHDEDADGFRRLVYHPHGLVTGSTVMTKSQYETQGATLAFALAVHAAFGSHLAIIGMSLEDTYLREQITRFRQDIGSITWFNSEFPKTSVEWARAPENNIDMVRVDWREFWDWWLGRGIAVSEEWLYAAWYRTLSEAEAEIRGGELTSRAEFFDRVGRLDLKEHDLQWAQKLGEPGQLSPQEVAEVSGVVDDLRKRIERCGFTVPHFSTTSRYS